MIVVSDTSVLSGLIKIGRLDILKLLFSEIIIPSEVANEIQELENFGYDLSDFNNLNWIKNVSVSDVNSVNQLIQNLDRGEAEAIILAIELKADYLLIDERKGRTIAENLGLTVTGLLGILIRAKEKNHIAAVKPILDNLILKKFRIHPNLYQKILELAGENEN